MWSRMNLKFYKLLEDLLKHIATKFHGHWICTLGVMEFIFRSSESARNANTRILRSHYDWKALKLEICLQLVESHKIGFELRNKHDMKGYKVIWLWSIFGRHFGTPSRRSRSNSKINVWVQKIIGDHLVETKGLKQVEGKGLKKNSRFSYWFGNKLWAMISTSKFKLRIFTSFLESLDSSERTVCGYEADGPQEVWNFC